MNSHNTVTNKAALHAAPNSVPQGNLRSDIAPKTLLRAAQINFAKSTVSRKRLPLRLDLGEYRSPDFRYDTASAEKVQLQLEDVLLNEEGMRWIHEPDAVLFYGVRTLDVPYDDFVARVDISRVGDCFRDVLGINTEVVSRDELGRPLLQVERIAALAQPNYTSFLGKDELDVYKLEFMEYGPDEQRNSMRTICSPNSSTSADDGYLAFCRVPDPGRTRIVFVARQSFPLPRLMVLARLDRWAWLRTVLTEDAYRRFWDETVANIVARYEGRQIGVGRPHRGDRPGLLRGLGVAGPIVAGTAYVRRYIGRSKPHG
jgi:hypothetical protein